MKTAQMDEVEVTVEHLMVTVHQVLDRGEVFRQSINSEQIVSSFRKNLP